MRVLAEVTFAVSMWFAWPFLAWLVVRAFHLVAFLDDADELTDDRAQVVYLDEWEREGSLQGG